VRLWKGVTAKECFLHLVSVFPLHTACPLLNALSYLCYAGVVDLKKGERRIGLLPEAIRIRNIVDCAGLAGTRKLPG
jgi:hypothetical protein